MKKYFLSLVVFISLVSLHSVEASDCDGYKTNRVLSSLSSNFVNGASSVRSCLYSAGCYGKIGAYHTLNQMQAGVRALPYGLLAGATTTIALFRYYKPDILDTLIRYNGAVNDYSLYEPYEVRNFTYGALGFGALVGLCVFVPFQEYFTKKEK